MKRFHDLMAYIFIRIANYHFDRGSFRDVPMPNAIKLEGDMFWPMIEKDVYVGNGNKLN